MESIERKYREEAWRALQHAKDILAIGANDRLRYAIMELRLSIEAIILGRVSAYQFEIQDAYLDAWQPRELLKHLLAVDPMADQRASLSVQMIPEEEDNWSELGEHRPLSLKELGKLHSSLGYFLHAPSINKMKDQGWFDSEKATKRCVAAIRAIEEVFAAPLQALKLVFSLIKFQCERCDAFNQFMNLADGEQHRVNCQNSKCGAPYIIEPNGDKFRCAAHKIEIACAYLDCPHRKWVWTDKVRAAAKWSGEALPALRWVCESGHENVITMRNGPAPKE